MSHHPSHDPGLGEAEHLVVRGMELGAAAYALDHAARGTPIGAESSLNKLFWSELDIRLHETALDLIGAEGEAEGPWSKGFLFSLAGPIYAGTNEIQRTIVAERLLGLPRK